MLWPRLQGLPTKANGNFFIYIAKFDQEIQSATCGTYYPIKLYYLLND